MSLIAPNASARLYELNAGGPTSYLLALHPGLSTPRTKDVVKPLVGSACALLLLNDPMKPVLPKKVSAETYVNRAQPLDLSPGAREVAQTLLGVNDEDLERLFGMHPGAAMQYVRVAFIAERGRRMTAAVSWVRYGATLPASVSFQPGLLRVAATIYRRPVDPTVLAKLVTDQYILEPRPQAKDTVDLQIFLRFQEKSRVLVELDPEPDPAALFDYVTASDLERLLGRIGEWMRTWDETHFWNFLLASFLADELRSRYPRFTPREYAHLENMILEAQPMGGTFLPGEEAKRRAFSNRHAAWVDRIGAAVRSGGAFVAVPASYAVPGLDPRVERTLLQRLVEQRIQVKESAL